MKYSHFAKAGVLSAVMLMGMLTSLTAAAEPQGKVLVFWASWCAYCKPSLRQLESLEASNALAGNKAVAVNIFDEDVNPVSFLRGLDLNLTSAVANEYRDAAGAVPALPWMVLVDAEGRVIAGSKPMKSQAATADWISAMTRMHQTFALAGNTSKRG